MNKKKFIVLLLFLIGLVIRIGLNYTYPSSDVAEYVRWGQNTHEAGLSESFEGGYFPVQYMTLGAAYSLSTLVPISPENVIRTFNLIFEIGGLVLLIYMLKKYLTADKVLLYFWLNPFSLIIYQQGYVDAQFSFFILLALAIIFSPIFGPGDSFKKYLVAGIPLGISLLMKPQTAPLFVGLAILAVILFFKKQRGQAFKISYIFIIPIILYAGFSLYFGLAMDIHNNHNTLPKVSKIIQEKTGLSERGGDIAAGSMFLTAQYLYVAQQRMPAINANMPNTWFFVADYLNKDNLPIYRIRDTTKVIPGISYRTIGFIIFFAILITLVFKIVRSNTSLAEKIIFVSCVIPIILPYLTTSAHENHFYLGFIGTIILGAILSDKFILKAGYILGVINAINLLLLYVLPHYTSLEYEIGVRMLVTGASSIVFFVLLYHLLKRPYSQQLTNSL